MAERRKRRRAIHSCIECHRRKQKCDRGFPCGNCLGRRAHEKCAYTSGFPEGPLPTVVPRWSGSDTAILQSSNGTSSSSGGSPESKGSVRSSSDLMWSDDALPERDEPQAPYTTLTQLEVDSLGYAKNSIGNTLALLKKVESHHGTVVAKHDRFFDSDLHKDLSTKYRSLIRQLPARPYCELLVTLFFNAVNWHYGVLDKEVFLELYETWWQQGYSTLMTGSPRHLPDIVQLFPALLYQVLAQALQFLPPDHDQSLEYLKMGAAQSFSDLSAEYSDCGMAIVSAIGRENATLVCVQQDFLRASWLKNSGRIAEAWHSLGDAISAAHEIGLHRNPESNTADTVEGTIENIWRAELSKRVWINLLIWDGHMSLILDRPMTINLRDCQVSPPVDCVVPKVRTARLPTAQYGVPSTLTARLLEYQLALRIPEILALHALGKYPAGQDHNKLEELHQFATHFQKTLPATHRFENPDTSWDTDCSCLPAQRELLVCHTNAFILGLHRPYILMSEIDQERAVAAALAILDSQKRLFHQFDVQYYKLYSLSFFTFDAAVMLSVVLISRPRKYTDIYPRALQCLADALDRLQTIAERISLAKTGGAVVQALLSRVQTVRCNANATMPPTIEGYTIVVDPGLAADSEGQKQLAGASWHSCEERPAAHQHQEQWKDSNARDHPYCHRHDSDPATDGPLFGGGLLPTSDIPIPTRDLATADLTVLPPPGDGDQAWDSLGDGGWFRLGDQDFHFEGDFGDDSFWSLMNSGFVS